MLTLQIPNIYIYIYYIIIILLYYIYIYLYIYGIYSNRISAIGFGTMVRNIHTNIVFSYGIMDSKDRVNQSQRTFGNIL